MISIVITACNRADSLNNLLQSLSRLDIHADEDRIPLIISIDNNGTPEVNKVAENYLWLHGTKEVIIHKEKKGLVKHFIWAGDLTENYEHVIFLEDDLLVSTELINYSKELIKFYEDEDDIAAASLYNPILNEATGTKFYQLEDGADVYFLQQPYWGNIWFKQKWKLFKEYLHSYKLKDNLLPQYVASWNHSFKKIYIQYLIETCKTVVTPRISLVTNTGVAGIHSGDMYAYQSNIQLSSKQYRFVKKENSKACYDAFLEIEPHILQEFNPTLKNIKFDVDLNGIRTFYTQEFVLTTRPVKDTIHCYTSLMKPTELGLIFNLKGNKGIFLCKPMDVILNSRRYKKHRRYNDILKNYHIGVYASFQITKYLFKRIAQIFILHVIGKWKI
jgi:hypothetical protein